MKHIIIFLIFLFCSSVFAQNTDKNSTNISEGQIFFNVYEATGEQLRITGTITSISASSLYYTMHDTASTSVDSLIWSGTSSKIDINFALGAVIGDKVKVSPYSDFPDSATIPVNGGFTYSGEVQFTNKLYYIATSNDSLIMIVR